MPLAILTTEDRFGLGVGKPWEEFATGCLRQPNLSSALILDARTLPTIPREISHVAILGPRALEITHPGRDIDRFRGQLTCYQSKLAMASYHPADAADQTSSSDNSESIVSDEKDATITQPSNYFFWMRRDMEKLLNPPISHPPFKFHAAPNLSKFIAYARNYINSTADPVVYLDIECRREDHVLSCIGIALGDSPVFVLPIYFWNGQRAYGEAWRILALLSTLLTRATVVVHNSLFDLFVLSRYYRVMVGHKVFDTMLCHHRCFAEAEKSLGHAISYWTYLPFHKDMAVENPRNPNQQGQLWEYNARDVYGMREVYKAQLRFLAEPQHDGFRRSVDQANRGVYPYLLAMLRGLNVDEVGLLKSQLHHRKRTRILKRVAGILAGDATFNPGSSAQCIKYFHDGLHYDVVGRTESGAPKMDQKALYKLRLKYPNPLLDVIIAYRIVAKEGSMLEFRDYQRPSYNEIPTSS